MSPPPYAPPPHPATPAKAGFLRWRAGPRRAYFQRLDERVGLINHIREVYQGGGTERANGTEERSAPSMVNTDKCAVSPGPQGQA